MTFTVRKSSPYNASFNLHKDYFLLVFYGRINGNEGNADQRMYRDISMVIMFVVFTSSGALTQLPSFFAVRVAGSLQIMLHVYGGNSHSGVGVPQNTHSVPIFPDNSFKVLYSIQTRCFLKSVCRSLLVQTFGGPSCKSCMNNITEFAHYNKMTPCSVKMQ